MPSHRSAPPGGDLDTLFRLGVVGHWDDDRLLEHFASGPESGREAAFEAIVRRHGPMVWRACLGVLGDPHAAEDAFQATFLVLARRAGSIRRRDALASWLFGVARRIALRSRRDASRRQSFERLAARPEADDPTRADPALDCEALLREVDRLPGHYRGPILLHDLGGCSYDEVARRLDCPIGTIKARLSRGRDLLRRRLASRGLAPTSATALPMSLLPPGVPPGQAVRGAVSLALGRSATVAASPAVAASARWMIHMMLLSKLKAAAALATSLVLLAAGAGAAVVASRGPGAADPGPPPPAAVGSTTPPASRPAPPPQQEPSPSGEEIDRLAREIADGLDDLPQRAELLLSLGKSQARRGQVGLALDTFRLAREAAERIPPDARTTFPHPIIRIAEAQAEAGDPDAALDTFHRAVELVKAQGEGDQHQNWLNLKINWLRSIGRREFRAVVEPYQEFLRGRPSDSAAARLALDAEAGDFDKVLQALRTWDEFGGPDGEGPRRAALVQIAGALRPEDREIADEVLAGAKRVAEEEPIAVLRAQSLFSIAETEARLGRFDDARETLARVDPDEPGLPFGADGIRFNKAGAFLTLAEEQSAAGDRAGALASLEEVVRIVSEIEEPPRIPYPLGQAAERYLELGEIETAEGLIAKLSELPFGGIDSSWLERVARARQAEGDEAGARVELEKALSIAEERLGGLLADPPEPEGRPASTPWYSLWDPIAQAALPVARLRIMLGDEAGALGLVDDLPEASLPDFLPALAGAFAREGRLDTAWEIVDEVESPKIRDRAVFQIALSRPAEEEAETGDDPADSADREGGA
jgi:RNA polymerase sigma factor (sigma-70 family)